MFDNIGDKIKTSAMVLCFIGIGAAVVLGIIMFGESFWLGIGTILIGAVASWVGATCLYGFGELIEETTRNRMLNEAILKYLAPKEEHVGKQAVIRDVPVAFSNGSVGRASTVKPLNQVTGGWICKACGTRNASGDAMCKDCGKYK